MAKKGKELSLEEKLEQALVQVEEQPYEVPENWCWSSLGSISNIISKGTTPKGGKDAYKTEGINFLRVENFNDDGTICLDSIMFIDEETHETQLKRSILQEKDVLISIAGSLGKTVIVRNEDLPLNTNQAVAFVRLLDNERVLPEYIRYYIASPQANQQLLGKTKVTSIPNLTLEIISDTVFPLPPLAEQKRIVDAIESMFAKLDEAKEIAEEVVESYDNRHAMILHKAFMGDYTTKWRKYRSINLDDWEDLTLDDIAEYKKGPFGSSITKAMFVPKGNDTYKVYEQGNAIRKTLEYGTYYISKEKYQELKGFAVEPGDIIISCAGTVGEVYKLPLSCERGVINQALMRVRLNSNIEEEFFVYYFGEILKGDVINSSKGTAIKNIPPFKVMKAMKISLPSIQEQKEIVQMVDRIAAKEEYALQVAEKTVESIEAMKKAILAKAFRGELGTNIESETSSIELLKEILATEV